MSEPVRVTEILNYFKEPWYIDWVHRLGRTEANKIAKASMKVGSTVDEIIKSCPTHSDVWDTEWFTKKNSEEVRNCLTAYVKWESVYKPKSIVNGQRLYATIEGYEVTGEPDIFVDDVLVDIKCAGKISPSYWIQVNMYEYLSYMNNPKQQVYDYRKVGILRLDKTTGSYEYVVKDYDANLVNVWCGLMRAVMYYKGEGNHGDEL